MENEKTMPGRRPKPTRLRVIEGNKGKRPLPKNEPQPEPGAKAPRGLSPKAKVAWQSLAPKLDRLGILTEIDALAFATFCETFARYQTAKAALEEHGLTYEWKSPTGSSVVRKRPEVGIIAAAERVFG